MSFQQSERAATESQVIIAKDLKQYILWRITMCLSNTHKMIIVFLIITIVE